MALGRRASPTIKSSLSPIIIGGRELVGKDKSGAGETLHNEGAGAKLKALSGCSIPVKERKNRGKMK